MCVLDYLTYLRSFGCDGLVRLGVARWASYAVRIYRRTWFPHNSHARNNTMIIDFLIRAAMAVLLAPFAVVAAPVCLLAMWAGRRDDKARHKGLK